MERKAVTLSLKAQQEGEFSAVFSTFDVVDHDGDVTRAGAFKDGAEVIIGSWGHKTYELPVGKGVIRATDSEASVEGRFFLDTEAGQQTYQTVKNLGSLGEWSYVFTAKRQSFGEFEGRQVRFLEQIEVYSVDPVLVGAGIDTRTTDIKAYSHDLAFAEHSAEIADVVSEYVARAKERAAIRQKEGRVLSSANVDRISSIAGSLEESAMSLRELLTAAEPPKQTELAKEFLRFQRWAAAIDAA